MTGVQTCALPIYPSTCEIVEISYGELLEKSKRIAYYLKKQGIKKGDGVAISLNRGVEQIYAVLGTLLSGGFYVPVGLHQPSNRRFSMIERAKIKYQITANHQAEEASYMIDLDLALQSSNTGEMEDGYLDNMDGDATAYVIFTSGSTGEPKGVEITHAAANNTNEAINELEKVGHGDCILAISALDFDLSVYDIFGVLGAGGSLAILPDNLYKDAYGWMCAIERMGVTLWNSVPALFEMLMEAGEEGKTYSKIRTVMLSGDWIKLMIPKKMKEITPNAHLLAMGGATEASIWSNYFYVDEIPLHWTSIPYGSPLPNQKYRIVENNQECSPGEEGEIQIGGKGVAKAYIGNKALTEKSFIKEKDDRWYRTGDRGMIDEDGVIWFRGRRDQQVKINGYRVELQEIEHKLNFSKDWMTKALVVNYGDSAHLVCVLTPNKKQVKKAEHIEDEDVNSPYSDDVVWDFIKNMDQTISKNNLKLNPEMVDYWKNKDLIVRGSGKLPSLFTREELQEKREFFLQVLTGERSAVEFLYDNLLAPEQVMKRDTLLMHMLEDVLDEILGQNPKRVAFLACRTGVTVKKIMKKLIEAGIQVTAVDTGRFFIDEMMKDLDEKIDGEVLDKSLYLPENLRNAFDMVISVNGLHGFSRLDQGLFATHQLLRNGGKAIAIEYLAMPAEAMITAGMIEQGFVDYDYGRGVKYSPLLSREEWQKRVLGMGFSDVMVEKNGHIQKIRAIRNPDFESFSYQKWNQIALDNLPNYMVPEKILPIYSLPLSKNGKVDVGEITSYFLEEKHDKGNAVNTPMEVLIADIWRNILGIQKIYKESSFFSLGGDSLLATRFLAILRKDYGLEISMNTLFETHVLKDLAKVLEPLDQECEMEEGEI